MAKKIIGAVLKSTLLFMATAVLLNLFLNREWQIIAIAVAISWAIGEIASLYYNKYSNAKSAIMKIATSIVIFIVVAFTTGILKNSNMWWRYATTATVTFIFAVLASPIWQKWE